MSDDFMNSEPFGGISSTTPTSGNPAGGAYSGYLPRQKRKKQEAEKKVKLELSDEALEYLKELEDKMSENSEEQNEDDFDEEI